MRRASFVHDQDRFLIDLSTWNPLELGRDSGRHAWDGYHVDAARLGLAVRASKPEATKEDHHIVVDPFPAGGRNGNLMGFINDPHVRGVVSGTDPDTTLTGKVGKSNAVVEEVRCFVVPLEWLEANREDATRIAAKGLPWNVPPPADAKIEGEKSKKRRKLTKSRPPPRGTDSDAEAPLVGGWAFPVMVAKRDILPSEDLRYFYGDPYWYDGHPFVFPQHSHGIPTAFPRHSHGIRIYMHIQGGIEVFATGARERSQGREGAAPGREPRGGEAAGSARTGSFGHRRDAARTGGAHPDGRGGHAGGVWRHWGSSRGRVWRRGHGRRCIGAMRHVRANPKDLLTFSGERSILDTALA